MQRPRLVATDVDGTLLGAHEEVSPRTRAVVARMVDAGVPLVLATGRPPRWIPRVCDALGLAPLTVAANGAVLYDAAADRVLAAETLDLAALAEVVDGLRAAIPGCGLAVERVGDGAFDRREEQFVSEAAYVHAWPHPDHRRVAPGDLLAEPVTKVLVRHPTRASEDMARAARPAVGHLVDVTYSAGGGLLECARRGVTKATGLTRAAAHHGVGADEVVAFGDMPNDLAMLRWAGHGVAVANAHPDVLCVADEVAASNLDDGVASVLERWF
ncbi:haloacid dehalogenase [Actinomycetospora sp. NBRC 106375]|uniref:HAD family hydrolase n=1 Tax=Actinomycetospora sp. NBRC 106375 TaxID=3032207 RepID=UPI00249FFDE7|nr:HAD family hydrolase [Actinomycetospora sp. NBRC 106375]GLZ46534.1 haloacid dehalogenase [Actinomycetospora sp. NBRC 106375]